MNQSNEISKFTEPDQDNAQPRTRRATRKHAASLRSTKEKEPGAASILEMSDAGPVETSRPLRTVKDLNHQMNSDQRLMTELEEESKSNEEANASTEIDEERPKRGRKNNSGDKLTQLDNTPAAKKPRRTNQSRSFGPTMEKESGASATSKATGKEHVKTSSQAKGRPSKTPSISQSPKRKKPLAVLSSNQKKENLEQIQRKSPRSSVTGVTDLQLSPQEDLVEDRQIARESEDNHSITPPNPRRKAKRKYVPNGLAPIGPPPSPPQIPDGLKGKWTYSEETRLFLADFRDITQVPDQDVKFLLELMARDDLVVVSEGLWGSTFETLMQLEYLEAAFGHQIHHKFRMFSKKKEGGYEEKPDGLSMRAKDFFRYLQKKMANDDDDDDQRSFLFTDGDGKCHEINVDDVSVYMIDCDLPKILPLLYDKYLSHCKMPEILPGGEMCMMNAVSLL